MGSSTVALSTIKRSHLLVADLAHLLGQTLPMLLRNFGGPLSRVDIHLHRRRTRDGAACLDDRKRYLQLLALLDALDGELLFCTALSLLLLPRASPVSCAGSTCPSRPGLPWWPARCGRGRRLCEASPRQLQESNQRTPELHQHRLRDVVSPGLDLSSQLWSCVLQLGVSWRSGHRSGDRKTQLCTLKKNAQPRTWHTQLLMTIKHSKEAVIVEWYNFFVKLK